jgi:hypothetical protein
MTEASASKQRKISHLTSLLAFRRGNFFSTNIFWLLVVAVHAFQIAISKKSQLQNKGSTRPFQSKFAKREQPTTIFRENMTVVWDRETQPLSLYTVGQQKQYFSSARGILKSQHGYE